MNLIHLRTLHQPAPTDPQPSDPSCQSALGEHHLENRWSSFYHTYFLLQRFGLDQRINELSGRVRSGQLSREAAQAEYDTEPVVDPELLTMVKKRLGYSDERWGELMEAPRRHYTDYPTYKRTFERLRAFFWLLYRLDRVPKTFYVKFCQPAA